jgi:hypothetical protein
VDRDQQPGSRDPFPQSIKVSETGGQTAREVDGAILTASPSRRGRELTKFLVAAGFTPDAVIERAQDLEEVFLQLTGGDSR